MEGYFALLEVAVSAAECSSLAHSSPYGKGKEENGSDGNGSTLSLLLRVGNHLDVGCC